MQAVDKGEVMNWHQKDIGDILDELHSARDRSFRR